MGGRIGWTGALLFAGLLAVGASSTAGQEYTNGNSNEGEKVAAQADLLRADMSEWKQAARLYRKAASLRDISDPAGVDNLSEAGRLSYYKGSKSQAVRDFEAAGDRALMIGDVLRAAENFADASWVAAEAGYTARALNLHERAQLLSQSPLLSAEDRVELQDRLAAESENQ